MRIASQKVIDSAKGAQCMVRFPGICNHDPSTTVWCHLNSGRFGKGMGMKAHDIAGFPGCASCHQYLDVGHGTNPILSTDTFLECILGAVVDSFVALIVAGIVTVPQDKPKARKPSTRKPKGERARIASNPDRKIPSRPFMRKPAL